MLEKIYEPEEIETAAGESIDGADPETSFFLGPSSESDLVYTFANKLEALVFLQNYYENQLSKAEKIKIGSQIQKIRKNLSDADTIPIADLFTSHDSLEIYAAGYWEDFVTTSQPFWQEWLESAGDGLVHGDTLWRDDDDDGSFDELEDDDDEEDVYLLFSEAPEDVFNPEFVDALMKIIPVA